MTFFRIEILGTNIWVFQKENILLNYVHELDKIDRVTRAWTMICLKLNITTENIKV